MWGMNCEQLMEYNGIIATEEEENSRLRAHIAELEFTPHLITEDPPVTVVESHDSHHGDWPIFNEPVHGGNGKQSIVDSAWPSCPVSGGGLCSSL